MVPSREARVAKSPRRQKLSEASLLNPVRLAFEMTRLWCSCSQIYPEVVSSRLGADLYFSQPEPRGTEFPQNMERQDAVIFVPD